MGVVFSTLEGAVAAAIEAVNEHMTDVHVICRPYPSGTEYYLTICNNVSAIYTARLKPDHVFEGTRRGRAMAFEAAKKFGMFVKQNKETINGYEITKSYTLINDFEDV